MVGMRRCLFVTIVLSACASPCLHEVMAGRGRTLSRPGLMAVLVTLSTFSSGHCTRGREGERVRYNPTPQEPGMPLRGGWGIGAELEHGEDDPLDGLVNPYKHAAMLPMASD